MEKTSRLKFCFRFYMRKLFSFGVCRWTGVTSLPPRPSGGESNLLLILSWDVSVSFTLFVRS
jgi:hypothetical protein